LGAGSALGAVEAVAGEEDEEEEDEEDWSFPAEAARPVSHRTPYSTRHRLGPRARFAAPGFRESENFRGRQGEAPGGAQRGLPDGQIASRSKIKSSFAAD